jgi:hypothetical protein
MTVDELYNRLNKIGIPKNLYYLHGLYGSNSDEDKLSLIIKIVDSNFEYQVYFKERGEKHSIKTFNSESDACNYIFEELKKNQEIENKYTKGFENFND